MKAKEPTPPTLLSISKMLFITTSVICAMHITLASRVNTYIQRLEEHKRSVIGNHVKDQRGKQPQGIAENFRKCQNKFDCLSCSSFMTSNQTKQTK